LAEASFRAAEQGEPMPNDPLTAAFDAALRAAEAGEVPVGAAVARAGEIIAVAGNRTLRDRDPTAHAEILAIRAACKELRQERLVDCDLYVTLEPCAMCAGAISLARIRRLYFGAQDMKGGGVEHGARFFSQPTCHHAPEVYGGMRESQAAKLLRDFFLARR
jgi:tRNA(Arg) A34 adenosine deaminase TadA